MMFRASSIIVFLIKLEIVLYFNTYFITCRPQQMSLNPNLGATDPLGGYFNYNLDTDSIIIQRRSVGATTYHLVSDPNGYPVFTRQITDRGRRFITFPHPSYPPGSGHFIILRKMSGQKGGAMQSTSSSPGQTMPQIFYEAFVIRFRDSLHGSVSDLDPKMYGFKHLDEGINNGKTKIGSKITRFQGQTIFMK